MALDGDRDSTQRASAATGLRGNRVARTHRFFLTDGRVLRGEIHRVPNTRLADYLSTLKVVISVTNAECEGTGESFPYIAILLSSILFIQET